MYCCFIGNSTLNCYIDLLHNIFILVVICLTLTAPANGRIDCSLGDNGVPNAGEFCSLTCEDGYKISGSARRMCQNNELWSGASTSCSRGTT